MTMAAMTEAFEEDVKAGLRKESRRLANVCYVSVLILSCYSLIL